MPTEYAATGCVCAPSRPSPTEELPSFSEVSCSDADAGVAPGPALAEDTCTRTSGTARSVAEH